MRRVSGISKFSVLLAALVTVAPTLGLLSFVPPAGAANPAYDIDQCANGAIGSTDLVCTGDNWQNGNLNRNNSHYVEGQSVPYRLKLSNIDFGTHVVRIAWDVTHQDKHAFDYLTTYNRTETDANPCSGVKPGNSFSDTATDPERHGYATPARARSTASSPVRLRGRHHERERLYPRGETDEHRDHLPSARTLGPGAGLGGHIASRVDWGAGNSAGHRSRVSRTNAVLDLDGKGGNKDGRMTDDAVIIPATVTVVKVAAPKDTQWFGFTATGIGPNAFTLADDNDTRRPSTEDVQRHH